MHDFVRTAREGRHYCPKILMWPKQWEAYNIVEETTWKSIKFDKTSLNQLPDSPGVYAFVVKPGIASLNECNYLLYIGKAEKQTLKVRCKQYLKEAKKRKPRAFILEMLENWNDYLFLYYATVAPSQFATTLEDALLEAYLPPMNKQLPGKLNKLRENIYR